MFVSHTLKDSKHPRVNDHIVGRYLAKCLKSAVEVDPGDENLSLYSPRASSKSVLLGEGVPKRMGLNCPLKMELKEVGKMRVCCEMRGYSACSEDWLSVISMW